MICVIFISLGLVWGKADNGQAKSSNVTVLSESDIKEDIESDDAAMDWEMKKAMMKKMSVALSNRNTIDYNSNTEVNVPVLMYHSINYEKGNELRVPKEVFREHMKYLHDKGFSTLTMEEYYNAITKGKKVPKKPVLVTFDDGYKDNYTNGFPILKEYNIKGTIFVITSTIDNSSSYLSSSEIKELQQNNIDIESHTVNHVELSGLSYEEQLQELKDSKELIDRLLNKNTIAICFPVGKFNDDTINACKKAGYKLGFTTKPGFSNFEQGAYKLKRLRINASTTVTQLDSILGEYE